ncbi:MAG TPA: hypothetical protein VIO61_03810 [Anaerolineaceae bacterium]
MKVSVSRIRQSLNRRWEHSRASQRIEHLARKIAAAGIVDPKARPVIFFNASTRLEGLSLNAAFSLLSSWAVRLSGVPVIHFACQAGMSRCVLGTNRKNPHDLPPCPACLRQSKSIYAYSPTHWFIQHHETALDTALTPLSLDDLVRFEKDGLQLGDLVLPSVRWVLRRHHLIDDEPTRFLYRQFILSAWRVAGEFGQLLDLAKPQAVVVFNGMFFPEATARRVAIMRGIRVITHEVCHQPMTAFFTTGDATAYPIHIPDDYQLTPAQEGQLNAYLEQRFQGNFSMAGIRFWPEMRGLDERFLQKAAKFQKIVPVFTNVIFDTSQSHANVIFPEMFAWMELILEIIRTHPETLFVIRAHPDETRPGKESCETVEAWVKARGVEKLPNVVFVNPREYISSYELIRRSHFVMVYNSTIGVEATLLGAAVLCGGKARYTQIPTVYFPQTPGEYRQMAEDFLAQPQVAPTEQMSVNARRFVHFNLYRACLPFGSLLEEDKVWRGFVVPKNLPVDAFRPENSQVMRIVAEGILQDKPFLMDGES